VLLFWVVFEFCRPNHGGKLDKKSNAWLLTASFSTQGEMTTFRFIAIAYLFAGGYSFSLVENGFARSAFHRRSSRTWSFILRQAATSDVAAENEPPDSAGGVVTEIVTTAANSIAANNDKAKKSDRVAVLVCPAQFCVPDDYDVLFENLSRWEERQQQEEGGGPPAPRDRPVIGSCRVAPLPRTEWIKVARQLPTRAFFEAKLPVLETLKWYFDAIERGLAEIFAIEGNDVNVCIIGHSIGGWVARAYLGGLSQSSTAVHRLTLQRCSSLITLGTPHVSPEGALFDQTRGLLRAIADAPSCKPQALADKGIDITCVCSRGLGGKFLSTNIEELVAATSYLPLLGRFDANTEGDGIVPLDLAFMDPPSRRVVVDTCSVTNSPVRHCHVVPTPWNLLDGRAASIKLPVTTFPSYVSEGVLSQWAQYIR